VSVAQRETCDGRVAKTRVCHSIESELVQKAGGAVEVDDVGRPDDGRVVTPGSPGI
jgi:hypothetical protein